MDITTDGFGFMLVFGDLAWVPFVYSLQSRYLVYFSPDISPAGLAFIFLLHSVGLWIFRGANSQKDTFRSTPQDPSVKGVRNASMIHTLLSRLSLSLHAGSCLTSHQHFRCAFPSRVLTFMSLVSACLAALPLFTARLQT